MQVNGDIYGVHAGNWGVFTGFMQVLYGVHAGSTSLKALLLQ